MSIERFQRLCRLTVACLGFALLCVAPVSADTDKASSDDSSATADSVSVRDVQAPEKNVGEVLLSIPSTILKTPVYLLKGITWSVVQGINLPVVNRLMNFGNPFAPFYLIAGYGSNKGLSGGTGFGFYHNVVPNDKLKFEWYYSTHRYQSYRLKYDARNLFSRSGEFQFRAEYKKRPHEYFYGLGNRSREDDETCYTLERSSLSARYRYPAVRHMTLGVSLGYSAINIFDGQDDDSEGRIGVIGDYFNLRPAVFRSTEIARIGLSVMYDTRASLGRIADGQYGEIAVEYNRGVGREDRPEFLRIDAEAGCYIHLFNNRILALRGMVQRMRNLRSESVLPFYYLSTLGGRDDLRSFRSHRLVDKDAVLITAEYRYPLWTIIDAFVFLDEGRVFNRLGKEFTFKNWHESYGVGLRIFSQDEVVVRTQVAFGDEAPRVYFELGASW